jgi:GT2 family glycosyltransferase
LHNPDIIWYAGARRRWGILAAAGTGRGQVDRGQFDAARRVDYVFGAAMFIRRSVFEQIGLFDEQFFLYLEDMDFCLRAQRAGFSLLFVPQARVWHKGSASTANNNGMRKYHYAKSTIYFLRKHASLPLSLPIIAFWTFVSLRAMMADLLRGDLSALRSYWSGLISGLADGRTL